MKQNVKIAKELLKLAKELSATLYQDNSERFTEEVNQMSVEELMKIFIDYIDKLKTSQDYRIKLHNEINKKLIAGKKISLQHQRTLNLDLPTMNDNVTGMEGLGGWYNTMNAFQKSSDKLNAVLIRINKTLQRFAFINTNISNLEAETREIVEQAINFLKNHNNQHFDKQLVDAFNIALQKRGLQAIRINSKQPADKEIPEYVKAKKKAGQLSAKLNKTLTLAANWTKASMLYIVALKELPEQQQVQAFVSNSSALIEQGVKVKRKLQAEEENKSQRVIKAGLFDSLKRLFGKIINKLINVFDTIKTKIDNFLKNDFNELDEITTELENILK